MELKDLKKAWIRVSDESSGKQQLNEEQIKAMLGTRTKSLLEKIERNIRTGFVVILVIIAAMLAVDYLTVAPSGMTSDGNKVPRWLFFLDLGLNLLIISLFVTFLFHYWKIRQQCKGVCDLRHTLTKTIGILTLYRRIFTFLLAIILLISATGFAAGYYTSIHNHNTSEGFFLSDLLIGILLLILISGLLFYLIRWVFRRVYGNYLRGLRDTFAELNEVEEGDD